MIMCKGEICTKRGRCKTCDRYELLKEESKRENENHGKQRLSKNVRRGLRR